MLAVAPAKLVKLVVILKRGLRSISKRITSLIFLNIYTPPQHALTRIILCEEFCQENFNIKLVFNSFKVKNYFSYKDPIPDDLKSFLVYKFTCASCSSS